MTTSQSELYLMLSRKQVGIIQHQMYVFLWWAKNTVLNMLMPSRVMNLWTKKRRKLQWMHAWMSTLPSWSASKILHGSPSPAQRNLASSGNATKKREAFKGTNSKFSWTESPLGTSNGGLNNCSEHTDDGWTPIVLGQLELDALDVRWVSSEICLT